MSIVTLTSDFGHKDHSVAVLKGKLLCLDPGMQIVDLSHEVEPYSIEEAAYLFQSAYREFPKGSIHIICVFNYYQKENELLLTEKDGSYFLGPNNGLFTLVFGEMPGNIRSIPFSLFNGYPLQTAVSTAVSSLLDKKPLEEIGNEVKNITKKLNLQAVVSKNEIRGSVIYFDHYGNAVVNIARELFERVRKERPFALYFKRFDPITRVSMHYMDAEIGEPICTFNSQGLLEISVSLGKARELLGLKKGDAIQIEFKD